MSSRCNCSTMSVRARAHPPRAAHECEPPTTACSGVVQSVVSAFKLLLQRWSSQGAGPGAYSATRSEPPQKAASPRSIAERGADGTRPVSPLKVALPTRPASSRRSADCPPRYRTVQRAIHPEEGLDVAPLSRGAAGGAAAPRTPHANSLRDSVCLRTILRIEEAREQKDQLR